MTRHHANELYRRRVWCGFSEGRPHVFWQDGERVVAVYKTRDAARRNYEDFRPVTIIYGEKKRHVR